MTKPTKNQPNQKPKTKKPGPTTTKPKPETKCQIVEPRSKNQKDIKLFLTRKKLELSTRIAAKNDMNVNLIADEVRASALNIEPDNSANSANIQPKGSENVGIQTKYRVAAKGNRTLERTLELDTNTENAGL